MKFKQPLIWLPPLCALLLLTGGYGLLPPRILDLGETCSDFCGRRLILVVFPIGLLLFGFAVVQLAMKKQKLALSCFLWCVAVVASGFINERLLDQDPVGAWLNWRSPFLEYHPEWGYSIENHEQIYRDPGSGVIYAGRGA